MLLTQMWNEEAREARGLRRMSVTVSSPADERKGRDWFHAGLVCRRAAIDAGSVRCSAAVAEQAVPAAHVGLFDSLKNFAADNLGNVLGGDFNLGSIGDLPAVIGEHFNADQLGEINRSLAQFRSRVPIWTSDPLPNKQDCPLTSSARFPDYWASSRLKL